MIQLHGSDIKRVRSICYEGVTLDEHLSWKEHVSKVFTKVSERLGLLGRIRVCLVLPVLCYHSCATSPVLPVLCSQPGVNCLLSARLDCSAYKIGLHV